QLITRRRVVSLTRPFSRKERSGWADSHFKIGEKTRPGCLYFFQPITIVLGGATATVRLQKYCRGKQVLV
ncbi:hypothetical protein P3452_24130, partial [Vibrio parahaemolyticus]|nr:hypothetical protein [Vibrio parahaemolyticus]